MRVLAKALTIAFCSQVVLAQDDPPSAAIDAYVQPYVRSGNLAGSVLVAKSGKIVFEKAYGFADRERHLRNTPATRFHIASLSMQFTAAAVLRLVDAGSIRLDQRISDFVPELEGANKISIRNLLTERSGLPDINALADYTDILQHHQTASSLVAVIEGRPLLFEPGSKFLHEEHSAYNLLALIVEKKTGLPFAAAMERLVFQPLGLSATRVDDDALTHATHLAVGYQPEGTYGLQRASSIHWSAKTGNASVYSTVGDQSRWVDALFRGSLLSASSREAILDTSLRVGYGWFKAADKRFGETAYYMNGRAPGFASFILYLPQTQTTVVVLSNIYSSSTTTVGFDIAALSLGLPYEPLHVADQAMKATELNPSTGSFQFGPDFYQPNAIVTLTALGAEMQLRWPSGEVSALIPMAADHFVDRSYWVAVRIERGASGQPAFLSYDQFRGKVTSPQQ